MNLLRATTLLVRLYTSFVLLKDQINQHLYLLQIGFYASLVDHEFKEFFGGHAKCALEWIQFHGYV